MQDRFNLWIDKSAIGLSGLCLLHCLATTLVIALLSVGTTGFFQHDIHKIGLALAIPLAVVGLGRGVFRHRRWVVIALGFVGIGFMAFALTMQHGHAELGFTVLGAAFVAWAHWLNIRCLHGGTCREGCGCP